VIDRIKKIVEYSKKINVLYVEDDEVSRENTLEFLKEIFSSIITAKDGKEALKKFKENEINLVITDILMPKLNGLELIEEIKNLNKDTYIIILSQNNENKMLLEAIKLNIDGYVLKPIEYNQLLNEVEKVTEKFKLEYDSKSYQYYLKQYLNLVEKSNIISKTEAEGIITYVNDSFCKICGFKEDEIIGKKHNIMRHPENPKELYEEMWHKIKDKKQTWEGVIKNRAKDGKSYYVKTMITPIKNFEGEIVEYIAVRDSLNAILDDKKYILDKIKQNDLSILVLVQIDEFEMLDKFYNSITIDQIEKDFSFNLAYYLPKSYRFENIYSLGDGRFGLLTDYKSFDKTNLNIQEYLNEFVQRVKNSTLKLDEMEFDLNITVSYAIGKFMLYEDAKAGLDKAVKKKTKLNFSNDFSIALNEENKHNLEMIRTVKIALENYNIVSYFQPIINNKTKEVEKYESLVRLIDERGDIISPFSFIDISKKANYYNKITERVLENSFKILQKIKTELSINISAIDIEKEQIREKIFNLLDENVKDAARIVFELLEDENIKDFSLIEDFIKEVKSKGVKIAIDDFGSGYSNFERLLKFEPDILKIDGSLIKNIENDLYSKNIVETVVLFAKRQKIKTVAEYVENEAIFNILNEIGVDYSQGYYFGKPKEL
jgi:PAS domain S-box-containing protein